MLGNVSRVLQTRKTIKIAWCFRKFHYNRDSNTNEHLSLSIAWASFGRCSQRRRKNALTFDSDLARSWALNMFWTQLYSFTPYERSARSGLCARSASLPYRPLYRFCVSMERVFGHASLKLITWKIGILGWNFPILNACNFGMRKTLRMLRHVFNVYASRSLDLEGLFVLGIAVHNRKTLTKKAGFESFMST